MFFALSVKEVEYVIEAITAVAVHQIEKSRDEKFLGLAEIAAETQRNVRSYEVSFQHLVREGVLSSIRGKRGGYILGKPASELSLWTIYSAMAKMHPEMTFDLKSVHGPAVTGHMDAALSAMTQYLASITIEDLVLEYQRTRRRAHAA